MGVSVCLLLVFLVSFTQATDDEGSDNPIHCGVAIVGGGIGGLYTAESLLRHKKETNVCVFERDTRLGGRIYDHVFPQVPGEYVGLGAWRIDMANHNLRGILSRLDIPYQDWHFYDESRTETRGNSSRTEQEIKQQSFPTLLQSQFQNMSFAEMHEYLFQEDHATEASNFATFETFQQIFSHPRDRSFISTFLGMKVTCEEGPVVWWNITLRWIQSSQETKSVQRKECLPLLAPWRNRLRSLEQKSTVAAR
ncbi:hypothetical protein OS493_003282 [Desmophyllum pertusum]|uniref:monoamine oxidase n=1 Tax=Desmophyllum pertusum TaxID=174260 RepID=A0A9W9YIC1_9CNID|nr:hypothetical protein OS493_003282 [Desmophyllum pertusum]